MRKYSIPAIAAVGIVLVMLGLWRTLLAQEPAPAQRPPADSPRSVITPKLPGETPEPPQGPRRGITQGEVPPPATQGPFVRQRTAKAGFHGKVIDEQGQPIPDVDVQIQGTSAKDVQAWRLERPITRLPQRIVHRTKSDERGQFFLSDLRYQQIDIQEIARQGYVPEPLLEPTFSLGAGRTKGVGQTAENPWIAKMWRRRGSPQPLITADLSSLILEPTGEPQVISLVEPGAQDGSSLPARLKLTIHRPKENAVVLRRGWSFSVESLDGEIAEMDDRLSYEAPPDGYRRKWEWTVTSDNSLLPPQVRKQLFLRTSDHQMYGRFFMDAYVYATTDRPTKCRMQIRSSVNPTGSRNLEPDPDQTFDSLQEYRARSR